MQEPAGDIRYQKHVEIERQHAQAERQARDFNEQSSGGALGTLGQVNLAPGRPTVESLDKLLAGAACEAAAPKQVKVALNCAAADTLRCLFFHGPTWDGNVPSKSGRDDLVNMGLAQRGNGWQWLTRAGIEACFANGIHDEKDRRESRERKRRHEIEDAARKILA